MPVTLTENAARHVQSALDQRGQGLGLRLGIKSTGCSGLMYVVDYADDIGDSEEIFESRGIKILVSTEDLGYLDGTEIDYGREGLNEAFKFANPNAKNACGCGESFNV